MRQTLLHFKNPNNFYFIFFPFGEIDSNSQTTHQSTAPSIRILLQFQHKGCATCDFMRSYRPSTSNAHCKMSFPVMQKKEKSKLGRRMHGVAIQDDPGRKRASPYSSIVLDAYNGTTQKVNFVGMGGKRLRVNQASFRRKVDDVAHAGGSLIEKCTRDSFYNGSNGYYDLNKPKVNPAVTDSNIAGSSEENDFDSGVSCSASNMMADKFSNVSVVVPFLGADMHSSDAESYCRSSDEEEYLFHPAEENVEVSIHELELHAYRCTLEALYASGPLNWDKELLLTNLRITLRISNDEHLSELKNLITSGST